MRIPEKSFVKVLACKSGLHNGKTGHVVGQRKDGYVNLLLTNHEKCVAMGVEVLVKAYKPRKRRERTWIETLADSLFWNWRIYG